MTRRGSRKQGSNERLPEERAGLILRYTVDATDVEAAKPKPSQPEPTKREPSKREPSSPSPPQAGAKNYAIELDVAAGFLWWWSLFELIELGGEGTGVPSMAFRSPEPTASASVPRLSRRAATRAGERAARKLSAPPNSASATEWPSTGRPPRLVQLAFILLAAAVFAGAFIATRNPSRHARGKPLTPPTTHSARHSTRQSLSTHSAARLNTEGYAKMRRGDYLGALPLLEAAVRRLHGTGSAGEAYADFNLANTRYHLGRCSDVLALLEHSQQIQGPRVAIDNLRSAAQKTCT